MWRQKKLNYWRRGNKYGAVKTEYNGRTYDSKLEAKVAAELDLRLKAGELSEVKPQVSIPLVLEGVKIGTYRVDFLCTHSDGTLEYVEAKGIPMPAWRMKWAALQAMHKGDKNVLFTVVTR